MFTSNIIQMPQIVGVAFEVVSGVYGTGEERRKRLESMGYDYSKIQSCVNDLVKLIEKYGEG